MMMQLKIEIGPCGADGCNKQEIVIKTKSSNGILSAYHFDDMSDFESNIVDKQVVLFINRTKRRNKMSKRLSQEYKVTINIKAYELYEGVGEMSKEDLKEAIASWFRCVDVGGNAQNAVGLDFDYKTYQIVSA